MQKLGDRNRIKLNWNVTGSYNVSKIIAKEIFDYEVPDYTAYEFIGLKGTNQKMSSSSGNVLTPKDLLLGYTPELILFMFAKYKPSASFRIGLDEDVLRNYAEYDCYQTSYAKGLIKEEGIRLTLELACAARIDRHPSFNQVASNFSLIGFNQELLQTSLSRTGVEYTMEEIYLISDRVAHWIKYWNSHRSVSINQKNNVLYFNSLTVEQRIKVNQLTELLKNETS
ncbi:lysyl-tRNA synthetase, class 1 [Psychrobacillus sp. OK032]|nr:lysyl-tRNA synthetase, class 1 [Psychrobacillus sp. OK032]